MDLALLQMPMVLFTTLVPMASGAFIGLALAFLTTRFSKERLARIDRWTLLPMAILAVGYIAWFVALSSRQYSMSLFQGVDIAPLSFVGIAGMLLIALAVVYWIIAMTGNLDGRPRKVFATVVGAASLLLSLSIGVMYMGSAVLTWNSPLVPLGIIGFCIAGGVPLGVLVVALAGGMPEARLTRLPTVALVTAFIGVVAAIVAVSAQLLFAQSTFNAFFPGSDVLPGSWVYLVISIVGFVVMLATLRAMWRRWEGRRVLRRPSRCAIARTSMLMLPWASVRPSRCSWPATRPCSSASSWRASCSTRCRCRGFGPRRPSSRRRPKGRRRLFCFCRTPELVAWRRVSRGGTRSGGGGARRGQARW